MHKILIKLKENTMSFCLYEATTPSRNLNNKIDFIETIVDNVKIDNYFLNKNHYIEKFL